MEKHPLFVLAETTPVVITGGKVYAQVEEMGEGCFEDTFLLKRRFLRKPLQKPLVEVGSLASLDELFVGRVYHEVGEKAHSYALQILEQNPAIKAGVGRINGDQGLAEVIYHQVFPYLRQQQYDRKVQELVGGLAIEGAKPENPPARMERLLQQDESKMIQLSRDLLREVLRDHAQERPVELERSAKDRFLDEMLSREAQIPAELTPLEKTFAGASVVIMGSDVYHLNDLHKSKHVISVAGTEYSLIRTRQTLDSFIADYGIYLNQEIQQLALQKIDESMIMDILRRNNVHLNDLGQMQEYREGDFGFVVQGGYYYVFLEMPPFAIHSDCDGNYYRFEKARLGIYVNKSGGYLEYGDGAVMIDNNNHPFLHNVRHNFAHICLGYNKLPTSGKDQGEVIAKRLRKTMEVLMFGYNGRNYGDCYKLTRTCHYCNQSHYGENYTTRDALEREGIPIIEGGLK